MKRVMYVPILLASVLAALPSVASAQTPAAATKAPPAKPAAATPAAAKTEAAAPAQPLTVLSIEQTLYLVRSTLMTLNDANRSGNYSVLRDLAAPDLQARHSAAELATSLAQLRQIDLAPVAITAPQMSAPPGIDANKMLRLVGSIPADPLPITFDLTYQGVNGQWRLFGLAVATPQPAAQRPAPTPAPAAAPAPAGAKAVKK
jgi:pyruvate/2-oxoglutarate dehydrogenase complex dihydrolipoamide acyltransferase (E2) component